MSTPAQDSAGFRTYWRTFAQFAGGRVWRAVALLVLISLLEGSGLLTLVPLLQSLGFSQMGHGRGLVRSFLTRLHGSSSIPVLPLALALFVVIKAGQAALRAWSDTLNLKLETDYVSFLRDRFYRTMMQANWLFLTRQRSSELTQAVISEIPAASNGIRQMLVLLSVSLTAMVQLAVALSLSVGMTALTLGSGLIVWLGLRPLRRHSFAVAKLGYGKRAEMASAVTEHLAGMKIAKGHGRESQHFGHFQRAMNEIAAHVMRIQRISALTSIWLETAAVAALALFVWFAVSVQQVDGASLLLLVFVFMRLLSHVTNVQNLWHQVEHALPSFAATDELRAKLAAAAEPPPPPVSRRLELGDAIHVQNLSFRYDPSQPGFALDNIDLLLPARQVTALCGLSGAGKSTLADVLLGLLTPEKGRVLIDGQQLANERLYDWRQSIGYVPQETFLLHDTIRNNLLWAQPDADEDRLRAALRSAAAEEFVNRLPEGLDTVVGDRGVRLAGGERQRIALARALLRQPTLLVLDEATSSLDTHNERLVQDAIERLHGHTTILLIAHRLSTVRFADRIVVLSAGRVAETGTWDELTGRAGGLFHQLVVDSGT
ncbi:MAG TPA: ABC transporter ATP-binding protein [Opitutaceae bacterium]|nr:ABC transporter ATP-binding protein [Opitutaceae bacterium]